jgi:hypothetical protein
LEKIKGGALTSRVIGEDRSKSVLETYQMMSLSRKKSEFFNQTSSSSSSLKKTLIKNPSQFSLYSNRGGGAFPTSSSQVIIGEDETD